MVNVSIRRAADVRLEGQSKLTNRSLRSPQHSFRLKVKPWQIVPCLIAPVLPGDTLKSASIQMRVLSKPIRDKLAGWWLEVFLFYVRLGDLADEVQDEWKSMLLTGGALTGSDEANRHMFQPNGKFPWVKLGYDAVVKHYFRNEASTFASVDHEFYAVAKIGGHKGWWDSLTTDDEMDVSVVGDPETWENRWAAYQGMRNAKLTTATYEEYLAMQGVAVPPQMLPPADLRIPELWHFTRDWQYPVQAVNPSDGFVHALIQWSLADRLKRARFAAEPGFILGLVCIRPKVFLKNQRGNNMSYLMDKGSAWMPSAFDTDPHARMRYFPGSPGEGDPTDGPVWNSSEEYWIDPKDYLQGGDQFTNYDLGNPPDDMAVVDLPVVQAGIVNPAYPSTNDSDMLFVEGAENNWLDVDGAVNFGIASRGGRSDSTGRRKGGW